MKKLFVLSIVLCFFLAGCHKKEAKEYFSQEYELLKINPSGENPYILYTIDENGRISGTISWRDLQGKEVSITRSSSEITKICLPNVESPKVSLTSRINVGQYNPYKRDLQYLVRDIKIQYHCQDTFWSIIQISNKNNK